MARFRDIPDHPEIGWIERTGYPSWAQPKSHDDDWDDDWDEEDEDLDDLEDVWD